MAGLQDFAEFVKAKEPLAPYTALKVGGPAEFLAQPRSREELAAVIQCCYRDKIPLRLIGAGSNVLVRDEGVNGAVVRLSEPAFTTIKVEDRRVRAGSGANLSALISQSARHGLAGLETLVGIPATVGGALRCNAGDRAGEIGQHVVSVEVMDERGQTDVRERDELRFSPGASNLDDPVMLGAEFELDPDQPDAIVKRMRKAWIQRKAGRPFNYQSAGRMSKNPRSRPAAVLIEQAGLVKTRVGGAEVSDRNANYAIAHPGASARDILRLIELVRSKVKEVHGIDLELEMAVW